MNIENKTLNVAGKKTQLTILGDGPPLLYLHSAGGETEPGGEYGLGRRAPPAGGGTSGTPMVVTVTSTARSPSAVITTSPASPLSRSRTKGPWAGAPSINRPETSGDCTSASAASRVQALSWVDRRPLGAETR